MFETPRAELTGRTKQVYVAIDPSGGGGSNFAMCSLYREDGRVVVRARVSCHFLACVRFERHVDHDVSLRFLALMCFSRHLFLS